MLDEEKINRIYIDYKVYSVIKLKDKYGFKIKLRFNDNSEEIKQIGGFKKKSEASEKRDEVITQLRNRTYIVASKIKVSDYMLFWLNDIMKPQLTYNSYMSYRNIVTNYIIPFMGEVYISQINIGHIQKLYQYIVEKSKSVVKIAKPLVKTSLEYAKDKNLINNNPALFVNLPKEVEVKPYKVIEIDTDKVLNIEQIRVLINASKNTPIYLHILFAVLMGLRKQEINGLKYSDIDFVNRKLYLQRQLGVDTQLKKEQCQAKTYTKQEIKLKSYSSERILDIPDMVFEAILEERKKYERNKSRRINDKSNPFVDEDFICCSTYGKARSKGFHRSYYVKLFEDNDLPYIRFHDLRHTYTTLLLMNNYNLKAVSQILGHASTIITANTYFDKNKFAVDCNEELNNYASLVISEDEMCNQNVISDLDMNLVIDEYIN